MYILDGHVMTNKHVQEYKYTITTSEWLSNCLSIHIQQDQKKMIKSQKGKPIGEIMKSQQKGRICYRKHCRGPEFRRGRHNGGYHCQTEF